MYVRIHVWEGENHVTIRGVRAVRIGQALYHLTRRIELVKLDAEVGRVGPRVHGETDLERCEGDPLHDGPAEVAQFGDRLDRPLRENVHRKRLRVYACYRR